VLCRTIRGVLGAAMVALLTSCVNLDADLTIGADALASGTYEVEIAKQAASLLGVSKPEDLKNRLLEGEGGILPKGNSVEVSERGEFFVMKVTLKDVPLTEEGMKAELQDDGRVRFAFVNEASDDDEFSGFGMTGTIDMRVTMPGAIIESAGFEVVDEFTVTYSGPVNEAVELTVLSESTGGGGGGGLPVLPVAIVLIAAAVIIVGVVRSRGSSRGSSSAMPETPTVAPE
jgi:hypothetical protein